MKTLSLLVVLTFAANISLLAQDPKPKFELPELHKIKSVTLSPAYSCRPPDEFQRGYENTALYLTTQDNKRNGPDLLFNGACGSEDYFEASLSGDDMSLIADLGADVSLEEITASRAFNLRQLTRCANLLPVLLTGWRAPAVPSAGMSLRCFQGCSTSHRLCGVRYGSQVHGSGE